MQTRKQEWTVDRRNKKVERSMNTSDAGSLSSQCYKGVSLVEADKKFNLKSLL